MKSGCISPQKENFQEIETEKEDIKEKFHLFKNDFSDEFKKLKVKSSKFLNLNNLKIIFLIIDQNHRKPGTYNHI